MLGHEDDEKIGASVLQEETESWICSVLSREGLSGRMNLINVYKYLIGE